MFNAVRLRSVRMLARPHIVFQVKAILLVELKAEWVKFSPFSGVLHQQAVMLVVSWIQTVMLDILQIQTVMLLVLQVE